MVKISPGLKTKEETYQEFGKFIISLKYLNENILLIKYLSYAPVPTIRRTKISNELKDVISFLLDTQVINYQLARDLDLNEKNLFINLITKAGLKSILKLDIEQLADDVNKLIELFYVLQGQVQAKNNNPKIPHEIKKVINKLIYYGKISESDGKEILDEL